MKLLDVADGLFKQALNYITLNKPKLNTVVLEARTVDRNVVQGGDPISNYSVVIPNIEPRNPFPTDFTLLGSNPMFDMTSDEGTMLVEFRIDRPMPQQIGRSWCYHCSGDGLHQLRLWQSYANQFRVDVVHPAFGRQTFKGDLNHLETDRPHKLAATWSAQDVQVAVDGSRIEPVC